MGNGYHHDDNTKGNKSITYRANIKNVGEYDVQVSYTDGPNRSNKTPITVMHADGEQKIYIDQRKHQVYSKLLLQLVFRFDENERDVVQITTEEQRAAPDAIRLVSTANKDKLQNLTDKSKETKDNLIDPKKLAKAKRSVEDIKKKIEVHKQSQPNKVAKVMSVASNIRR